MYFGICGLFKAHKLPTRYCFYLFFYDQLFYVENSELDSTTHTDDSKDSDDAAI